jgi:hypothetical protein
MLTLVSSPLHKGLPCRSAMNRNHEVNFSVESLIKLEFISGYKERVEAHQIFFYSEEVHKV